MAAFSEPWADGEGGPLFPEDLFDTSPTAAPQALRDAVRRDMGMDVPARPRPPDGPDVSRLAEGLGLK